MNVVSKAVSALFGLVSPNPMRRVLAAERLLAFHLQRLPEQKQGEHFELASELPPERIADGKLYPSREVMLHVLPKGGRVAEVGTFRGGFSQLIASICKPEEFHLMDLSFAPLKEAPIRAALGSGTLHKHEGDSSKTLRQMDPASFDWLYIDGDHEYSGVVADLVAADRVLKPGGFLMCNDYTNWDMSSAVPYGVAKAVNEFCIQQKYDVVGFALQGAGFHDILLRKPIH